MEQGAVPIALAIGLVWSFVMQTSGEMDELERVTGWSALLRELPATALLLAPLVGGLALGVHSTRLGSRRGVVAMLLHSLLLVLVLAQYLWFDVAGGATAIAITVPALAACVYLAWMTPSANVPDRGRTAGRLRLAALLTIAGTVGAFAWLLAGQISLSSHVEDFSRASVPDSGNVQVVTLPVDQPDTYYLYVEGNAVATLGDLAVRVTGPTGGVVAVQAVESQPAYLRNFRGGHLVGHFEASRTGTYRVAATGILPSVDAPYAPANPYGDFAVGDNVTNWMRPHERGSAALLVLAIAASIVLALVAGMERQRHRA